MKVTFLCGCVSPDIVRLENITTMDSIGVDSDGMMVCAQHKQRRYGWRSHGRNWQYASYTPFELENQFVFNISPYRPKIEYGKSRVKDMRDNRDPVEVYNSERAKS